MTRLEHWKEIEKGFYPYLAPIALGLHKYGVTANWISLMQFPFIVLTFRFLFNGDTALAAAAISATLLLDLFDGYFARVTKTTSPEGHVYDKTLDLLGIYAVLGGLVYYIPELIWFIAFVGLINLVIYGVNEFYGIEIYTGMRTWIAGGLLLGAVDLALGFSIFLGIGLFALKATKV